jgi:putative transport protein
VRDIGLIMFLYGVGIQFGKQFFEGLAGPGRRYNVLALVGVLAGLAVAVAGSALFGLSLPYAVGVFAGALTNTPTLQAALAATGSQEPAVGYSVAYPLVSSARSSVSTPPTRLLVFDHPARHARWRR